MSDVRTNDVLRIGGGLHACLQGFPRAVVELSFDGVVTESNGKLEQLLAQALIGRLFSDVLDITSQRK